MRRAVGAQSGGGVGDGAEGDADIVHAGQSAALSSRAAISDPAGAGSETSS